MPGSGQHPWVHSRPPKDVLLENYPQRKKRGQPASPTPPAPSLEVTRGGGQPSGAFSNCLCAEWEEGRWKQQQGGLSQVCLSRCGDEAALSPASPALFSGYVLKTARAWVVHVADINSGACFCRNRLEWFPSFSCSGLRGAGVGGAQNAMSHLSPPHHPRPSDTWIHKHVRRTVVKEMDFASQLYPHRSAAR